MMMTKLRTHITLSLVFSVTAVMLMLTAFVSGNWVRSRHGFDSWGLWQICEFRQCKTLVIDIGWYDAARAFGTAAFVTSILSILILFVYAFSVGLSEERKRLAWVTSMLSALVTIALVVIGVVIIGTMHGTLGGELDVFGNITRYDLDWGFILACISAGCFAVEIVTVYLDRPYM